MKKIKITVLIILGVLFIGLGIYYWLTKAGSLPSWLPGYEAGSDDIHFKHGLAAAVLGVGCFIWAWFASAPAKTKKPTEPEDK